MTIGSMVRKVAGKHERTICAVYRRVFVDLRSVADRLMPALPLGAHIVDVGGGDGELLNLLPRDRPDLSVTMIDLRDRMGLFLEPEIAARVKKMPSTSLAQYKQTAGVDADVVLVSDVVHHVPIPWREEFMRDAHAILRPGGVLIIKDVARGEGFIAWLGVFVDRFISGDKNVSLESRDSMRSLVEGAVPMQQAADLLGSSDSPNFAALYR